VPPTFEEAFCAHFNFPKERFAREAMRRSLYPCARRIWPLLDLLGGPAILIAKFLIDSAARTRGKQDLLDLFSEYRQDIQPQGGFLAKKLKLRVSTQRLLVLNDLIRERAEKL